MKVTLIIFALFLLNVVFGHIQFLADDACKKADDSCSSTEECCQVKGNALLCIDDTCQHRC